KRFRSRASSPGCPRSRTGGGDLPAIPQVGDRRLACPARGAGARPTAAPRLQRLGGFAPTQRPQIPLPAILPPAFHLPPPGDGGVAGVRLPSKLGPRARVRPRFRLRNSPLHGDAGRGRDARGTGRVGPSDRPALAGGARTGPPVLQRPRVRPARST